MIGTRDRTVHLAPPEFLDAVRALPREAADAGSGEYDLHLIGRRHLRSNNSWLHNVPAMVKGRDRCTALMHPDDAARRGLAAVPHSWTRCRGPRR
ncbi:anaerobic selenocysteine-containing dehydrogenase [Nocardia sp. GAS34]